MMGIVHVSNESVRPFFSEGDVDAVLTEIKLAAKLRGKDDLATFKLLYLDGSALTLYFEMKKNQLIKKNISLL